MSYHGLTNKNFGKNCPCGKQKSSVFFELCWNCQKFKNKKLKKLSRISNKNRIRNENALKKMTKLPAKNRKKSKIIDALMNGVSPQKTEAKKPKTIRYESLERKLLLKELESL